MKTIQECYPELKSEDDSFYGPCDYDPMVECFGTIALAVSDHDYQGDTRYLLRDGARWGVLVNGWGSCSGCDALQACDNWRELEQLREGLGKSIVWFDSPEKAAAYLTSKDWDVHHSWREEESRKFVTEALAMLQGTPGEGAAKEESRG